MIKILVWGCPQISKPLDGWVEHNGNLAKIGCNMDGQIAILRCNGSQWIGDKPICPKGISKIFIVTYKKG